MEVVYQWYLVMVIPWESLLCKVASNNLACPLAGPNVACGGTNSPIATGVASWNPHCSLTPRPSVTGELRIVKL
jgi:hypothetical protein